MADQCRSPADPVPGPAEPERLRPPSEPSDHREGRSGIDRPHSQVAFTLFLNSRSTGITMGDLNPYQEAADQFDRAVKLGRHVHGGGLIQSYLYRPHSNKKTGQTMLSAESPRKTTRNCLLKSFVGQ